jgi:uncharacterized protein (DUF2237 family)
MTEQLNVLGGELEPCGMDPVTGFYRDGCCAVVTEEFLAHQASVGNDLSTPRAEYGFAGLTPGDRWCVVALRWAQAYNAGVPAPIVLAATNIATLEVIPLEALQECAVDVPPDASALDPSDDAS